MQQSHPLGSTTEPLLHRALILAPALAAEIAEAPERQGLIWALWSWCSNPPLSEF